MDYTGRTLTTATTVSAYDGVIVTEEITLTFLRGRRFRYTHTSTERDTFDGDTMVRATEATGAWRNTVTELQLVGEACQGSVEYKHCADEDAGGHRCAPVPFSMAFGHDELASWKVRQ